METLEWLISAAVVALALGLVKWLLGKIITSEYQSYARERDSRTGARRPGDHDTGP